MANDARRVGFAVLVASVVAMASSAAAATNPVVPMRAGDVRVVDADTRQRELERGGSATEFAVEPPDGASCPGDSEHDSWRVQTFIVPASVDPGTIPYGVDWPKLDEHMYSLYDTITQPVIDVLTVSNPAAGSPGRIDGLAPLSFAVFPVGELVPGRYRIGIACTLFYDTADYWDSEIVIDAAADDSPGQMVWRLADAPATAPASHDSSRTPWPVVAGIAIVLGLVVIWFGRRRVSSSPNPRSKELQ